MCVRVGEEGRRVVVVVVQTIGGSCMSIHARTPMQLIQETETVLRLSLQQQVAGVGLKRVNQPQGEEKGGVEHPAHPYVPQILEGPTFSIS